MKSSISRLSIQTILSIALTAVAISPLHAEHHCPGNIASVTPRFVQRALIIIPVKINNTGPFDFMVDTGSQLSVIDPSLALELHLKSQGTVGLIAVTNYTQASIADVDTLETGSHIVQKPLVVVQDLGQIRAADPRIRGVLGENFFAHFDVFIDYSHKLLCLDESKNMGERLRGERIPLVAPQHPEDDPPFTGRLVVSVHLSDTGGRRILLQLDSGSDGPILYPGNKETEPSFLSLARLRGDSIRKAQRAFAPLPSQDMRIGSHIFSKVPFVTPANAELDIPGREEDGLLPTILFRSIYISFANRYVMLDPR